MDSRWLRTRPIFDHVTASAPAARHVNVPFTSMPRPFASSSASIALQSTPFPCHAHIPTYLASNLPTNNTQIAQSRQHKSRVPPQGRQSRPKHHGLVG